MGMFTPDNDSLRQLYRSKLKHALSSEKQIVDALPKMIENSSNTQLAGAFRTHLQETKEHVSRLQQILKDVEGKEAETKCKVTAELVSATESDIKDAGNDSVRDVALIADGNLVEHFEIASYGTLRTWAEILGQDTHVELLEKTLQEEKHANEVLTQLSRNVNVQAPVNA